VAEGYEAWFKDKEHLHDEARNLVHDAYVKLMHCAEEHERTVSEHANSVYDSFDENSRIRAEGVRVIISHGRELVETARMPERRSAFAGELLERDLRNVLNVLNSVLKTAPKDDSMILSIEDHRKSLLDMKVVTISRNFRLEGCGDAYPISIEALLSSTSSPSELSCDDRSAHDGGAVIDPVRRQIITVSGNCNNGKDVFFIDIDKKTSERFRNIIPYGNHGQYPVYDGEKRVYFLESESRNNDSFGYLDVETKTFTRLKSCPRSFREFCSAAYMNGKVYAVCRDKNLWAYTVENDAWENLGIRLGKVRIAADPLNNSLMIIKKRTFFCSLNVETKERTEFAVQPRQFNLGSNQEFLFLRRSMDDFIVIASFDSHSLLAYISRDDKWVPLRWRDVRNGSAHMVFDPITSAFYYKIDSERTWYTVSVPLE